MKRINQLIRHRDFQFYLKEIERFEAERIFCKHDIAHFFDVARIAYILKLENHLKVDREIIYAAALLHDIGRYLEYKKDIPHDQASVQLAEPLLIETKFNQAEREIILSAISSHRRVPVEISKMNESQELAYLLFHADKSSRLCLFCPARDACYWEETRKNRDINY
ncbi:HD domain-containing protein [Vagococcus elongatus]|uniref:HD domain-containing protein n=1 Tax=Vagococcus elongatus TaxID=180344 RepID=A0A430AZP2_9ENTE|nr:HD domain-containing protein [Vagococcus elongatus]RSU13535.1 hypothetical protein CBF29_04590 [Vagococcus elongatus]